MTRAGPRARAAAALCACLALALPAAAAGASAFQRALTQGLELHRSGHFEEALAAFSRALELLPDESGRANLEYDIAACEYELGRFGDAEARFVRVAELDDSARGDALLHAGWAALRAGDAARARQHLAASAGEGRLEAQRQALSEAIEAAERERAQAELDGALEEATSAYGAGDLARASAALERAEAHADGASPSTRANLYYLGGLVARERGDRAAARALFERSLRENPDDGSVHALLGELAQDDGDDGDAERHYRASLQSQLSPEDASAVQAALDALYLVPPPGLELWAVLGGGYDSNATQSGSSDAVGFSSPDQRGSPFASPAWGIEYRWQLGSRSRLGPYYAGEWLALGNAELEDASLQSHEAGLRWYLAPSSNTELSLAAAGALTLSGLELSPFSLEAPLRGRFALQHGARFQSSVSAELRPMLGLADRQYLTGTRADLMLGERYQSGPWGAAATLGLRYNAIGTQHIAVDPAQFPRCNFVCQDARYEIPLGYAGPFAGLSGSLALSRALTLGLSARYEYRTYLAESRIDGALVPAAISELSAKTRHDDRYTLGGRARYQLEGALALGLYADYTLRISRSNVAFRRGDLDYAFDYDDRNFTQQIVELGVDLRL